MARSLDLELTDDSFDTTDIQKVLATGDVTDAQDDALEALIINANDTAADGQESACF